jgi:subtilisin family serine protease
MTTRVFRRAAVVAVLVLLPALSPAAAPAAPPSDTASNEVYYTVTASFQGAPEDLWEITARFLGDASRAGEVLDMNSGRVQPDGRRLTDPSNLREGWQIMLPWDAVGPGLTYGPLPAPGEPTSTCDRDTDVPAAASWGQTLLAPGKAWTVTDGAGTKVAVIGSGVDGSAPELADRVTAGTDITAGAGRGDTACRGSGTALAGIVAGDDGADGEKFGVAPGARIVPVKAATDRLPPHVAAIGIHVAAESGAEVILIGADIDAADQRVRTAIADAISRDTVVVVPASAEAARADGLLRVGAIAENREPVGSYPADAVDLSAPGADVASIGGTGTGPAYAAAFVAGTVALVRSAHPGLPAAEVTRQVLASAADNIVSPAAAVSTPLTGSTRVAETSTSGLGTLSQVLLWLAVGLVAAALGPFLIERPVRMATGMVRRHRANRQAREARARITDDNDDPFWTPPRTLAQSLGEAE